MKWCCRVCVENALCVTIVEDLKAVNSLARIFEQSGWNHYIGTGFYFLQEIESRVGSINAVYLRILKSGSEVSRIVQNSHSETALQAVKSMAARYDVNHRLTSFPTIEAIIDCCDVLVEAQKSLEAVLHPTIHLVLPRL